MTPFPKMMMLQALVMQTKLVLILRLRHQLLHRKIFQVLILHCVKLTLPVLERRPLPSLPRSPSLHFLLVSRPWLPAIKSHVRRLLRTNLLRLITSSLAVHPCNLAILDKTPSQSLIRPLVLDKTLTPRLMLPLVLDKPLTLRLMLPLVLAKTLRPLRPTNPLVLDKILLMRLTHPLIRGKTLPPRLIHPLVLSKALTLRLLHPLAHGKTLPPRLMLNPPRQSSSSQATRRLDDLSLQATNDVHQLRLRPVPLTPA